MVGHPPGHFIGDHVELFGDLFIVPKGGDNNV